MEQQHIDSLLERYLNLVDEYSRLREELSNLQVGVFQNIARANFIAERGVRYGQDYYDERMRALRVLDVTLGEGDVPVYTVRSLNSPPDEKGRKEDEEQDGSNKGDEDIATAQEYSKANFEGKQGPGDEDEDKEKREKEKTKKKTNDPLHWFGLFVPVPLRTAQTLSIQAVEHVIPRLVSVNAEMEHVEIEIRRARKKRAKATAAAVAEKEGC